MTGLLKDLMQERADSVGEPELDLASITRTGDRRVHARRTAWVGGIAAATTLAALVGPSLAGGGADGSTHVAGDGTAASPRQLAWVVGSSLHRTGEPDVDLGTPVRAWVLQGDPQGRPGLDTVVYTDDDHRVHVWTDGTDRVVGRTVVPASGTAELVADVSDVAWVDAERGLTRYDVSNHTLAWVPAAPGSGTPQVTAVDTGVVYAVDARGVVAWDASGGEVRVVDPDPARVVMDAEHGTMVRFLGNRRARVTGPGGGLTFSVDSFANLSPDRTMVAAESGDEGVLLDAATGERRPLDSGHEWSLAYSWLDDDSVAVLAFDGLDGADGEMQAFVQACDTVTGACDGPGVELPGAFGEFQLPNGIHLSE